MDTPETAKSPAQAPSPAPVTAASAAPVADTAKTYNPSQLYTKHCPKVARIAAHEERLKKLKFDTYFAGAKAAGKWEDEWPALTEKEFIQALQDVGDLSIGNTNHDGTPVKDEA